MKHGDLAENDPEFKKLMMSTTNDFAGLLEETARKPKGEKAGKYTLSVLDQYSWTNLDKS